MSVTRPLGEDPARASVLDEKEREELEELRAIVAGVTKEVQKAATIYMADAPLGRIRLKDFLEVLVAQGRRFGKQEALETFLTREVRRLIEERCHEYLQNNVLEMIFLPVLIRRRGEGWKAYSLRGGVRKASKQTHPLPTPEEAYEALRKEMVDHFAKTKSSLGLYQRNLMEEYDAARFLKEDVIADLRVFVKVLDTPGPEDGDSP